MQRYAAVVFVLFWCVIAQGENKFSTPGIECDELKPGQSATQQTAARSDGNFTAYATVSLARPVTDKEGRHCQAKYSLFVADGSATSRAVKTFTGVTEFMVGAAIVGFSKDHTKLAADFWWAGGDYTGHRPVIYDVNRGTVRFAELNEEITGRLPSCDYFEEFVGVTNSGEAIIHVPKSEYVDEGCPDQGNWAFDLAKKTARRLGSR